MKVQIINYSGKGFDGDYTFSSFAAPRSLDEFELNIIDLSDEKIWYNDQNSVITINSINDFKSVGVMVTGSKLSKILFVLPQDISYRQAKSFIIDKGIRKAQYGVTRIKDMLPEIEKNIILSVLPIYSMTQLVYENTITKYGNCIYNAAFFFSGQINVICKSEGSNKTTMIMRGDKRFLTTLDITKDKDRLDAFVSEFLEIDKQQEKPSWVDGYSFFDDEKQLEIIEINNKAIDDAKGRIQSAQKKLDENNRYKSILYTTGDELFKVVISILEELLSYDLSKFVDEKKEDFLIKKDSYTLIGEIKGVASNIRSENISQVEVHFQGYKDKLAEEGLQESVHQVLIMNPFRNKPLSERDPVHDTQIKLAERNGCLIIETATLLKLYEKYVSGEVDVAFCEKLFTEKTGLLKETDF